MAAPSRPRRWLEHIGGPTQPPAVLPARSPPLGELPFDRTPPHGDRQEMDQTEGPQADGWE